MTDWKTQLTADLAAAETRITRGREEMAAGGDDRARAIAAAVTACQETLGGQRGTKRPAVAHVAQALNLTVKSVDTALAKVNAGLPARPGLPWPVWEKLAAAELDGIKPLTTDQWAVLGHLVRGTFIDEAWIDAPGELLARDIEELADDEIATDVQLALTRACRSWNRAAALAVLDALSRGDQAALPTAEQP